MPRASPTGVYSLSGLGSALLRDGLTCQLWGREGHTEM